MLQDTKPAPGNPPVKPPTDQSAKQPAMSDREFGALLFERFGDRMFDFAYAMTRDHEDACGIVQDVLVLAARRKSFPSSLTIMGFLYEQTSTAVFSLLGNKGRIAPESRVVELPAPPAVITRADQAAMVWEAMSGFSERDQAMVLLGLGHNLSNKKVADVLGFSLEAIEMMQESCYERVQQNLGALLLLDYLVQNPLAEIPDSATPLIGVLEQWDGHYTPLVHQKTVSIIKENKLENWLRSVTERPLHLLADRTLLPAPYDVLVHIQERIDALSLLDNIPPPPKTNLPLPGQTKQDGEPSEQLLAITDVTRTASDHHDHTDTTGDPVEGLPPAPLGDPVEVLPHAVSTKLGTSAVNSGTAHGKEYSPSHGSLDVDNAIIRREERGEAPSAGIHAAGLSDSAQLNDQVPLAAKQRISPHDVSNVAMGAVSQSDVLPAVSSSTAANEETALGGIADYRQQLLVTELDEDSVFTTNQSGEMSLRSIEARIGHPSEESSGLSDDDDTADLEDLPQQLAQALQEGSETTGASDPHRGEPGIGSAGQGAGAQVSPGTARAVGSTGQGQAGGIAIGSTGNIAPGQPALTTEGAAAQADGVATARKPRQAKRRRRRKPFDLLLTVFFATLTGILLFLLILLYRQLVPSTPPPTGDSVVEQTTKTPGTIIVPEGELPVENGRVTSLVLANTGATSVDWAIANHPDWIQLTTEKGTLGAGEISEIGVSKIPTVKEGEIRGDILVRWKGIESGEATVKILSATLNPPVVGMFIPAKQTTTTCSDPFEVTVHAGDESGVELVEVHAFIPGEETKISANLTDQGPISDSAIPLLPHSYPGSSITKPLQDGHNWQGTIGPFPTPGTYVIEIVAQDTLGTSIEANRGTIVVEPCPTQ